MRSLLPAIVVGLAIMLAVPVYAKGDDGDDDEDERREGQGRGHGKRVEVGDFSLGTRDATGKYVSFRFNESGLFGFTVSGTLLFDLVPTQRAAPGSLDVEQEGANIEIESRSFRLRTHDNPTGATRIVTPGGGATLTLAPNGRVALDSDGVRFTVGNLSGTIRGDDLRVSGQNVTAANELLVFLQVSRADVDKNRPDIGRAIVKRHVGAEATIASGPQKVKEEVVSYGNVTMTTVKAEKGNLTIQIEGHGTEGRVLVFNVDGRVIGAAESGHLSILLDNESISYASDLRDALDPADDGFKPEAYVVFDPAAESFQLIITVPHYSIHTLTVNVVELVTPSVVVGLVAGVALLVPSAYVLFRRK